ncbi:two-component sensor histidine kinase [Burkholderia sp. SRS-W-2-2016]|uniref:sensor histidine kinase n=1 Tax=Burkholderia sp. SRS-W-2-2016 TaxID=1926878 RepID=UPI00094ABCEE|nr:HAMP domain-containing sensor histidine kinase [Burkholderia sp. SRS-W-2-2016]OLL27333.1 two-component sensor histidine kinase [Burkholderia sp. SRS-W-2-2016]
MRLADFILDDMETILAEWEAFAGTLLPAAAELGSLALRDHAPQILASVAKDLATHELAEARISASSGLSPLLAGAPETAAQMHAILLAQRGFDINQLLAEYRALRTSVLRLWLDSCQPYAGNPADIARFNEAIDQAIAESVSVFTAQVEQARNLLLGMLGHDMRSPLQTIQMTASYLAALNAGEAVSGAASRLIRSGARMQALLDDMLDFNRTRLGLDINIAPTNIDLEKVLADELDQLRAVHPDRQVDLEVAGDCRGIWDGRRLQQLLGNLVLNAIKYGTPDEQIRVHVTCDDAEVTMEVKNIGPVIASSNIGRIFDPLQRGPHPAAGNEDSGLGLGLYIARAIARAHGGEIEARSDEKETVFAVHLPRRQQTAANRG